MEYYQAQSAGYFKRLGFRVGGYGKEFISLPQYHESFDDEDMIYFKTTRTLNKRMTQFINEHRDEIKAFEAQKDKEKLVQQEKKKVDQATIWHAVQKQTSTVTATATATATTATATATVTHKSESADDIEALLKEKKAQLEDAKTVVIQLCREIAALELRRKLSS